MGGQGASVPTRTEPNQPQPASTDTVSGVGAALGGMLSEQTLNNTKAEVQKLVDSASSGGFAISEEGADMYIRVFRDFQDQLSVMQETLLNAGQKPQLGDSLYAKQDASHTQSIATGDAQSYEAALNSLTVVVQQAQVAFEQAKKNYAKMDDEAAQTFGRMAD